MCLVSSPSIFNFILMTRGANGFLFFTTYYCNLMRIGTREIRNKTTYVISSCAASDTLQKYSLIDLTSRRVK